MKNFLKVIIVIFAIIIVIAAVILFMTVNSKQKSNLAPIDSAEKLSELVNSIYDGLEIELPFLETQIIDTTDNETVQYVTGLENGNDLEYLVVSQPMMTAQAYSLVLAKVKDGVSSDSVAKAMNEKTDARKWICVTAEKIYSTSSGDVVCLVMANAETAKAVYDKFKTLAGNIGQEYERTEQEPELPADMY